METKDKIASFLENNSNKVHKYTQVEKYGDEAARIEFLWVEDETTSNRTLAERTWNFNITYSNTDGWVIFDINECPHGIHSINTFIAMLSADSIIEYMVEHGINGAW